MCDLMLASVLYFSLLVSLVLLFCRPAYAASAADLANDGHWLNTEHPLSIKDLRGKVVLLDFWTNSCINCIHTIPKIKELESKYGCSLVVIGIHTPKYENERDEADVKAAIQRYRLNHPILNDPHMIVWNRYRVTCWPTFVLIDPKGEVIGAMSGDKHLERLDKAVSNIISSSRKTGGLDSSKHPFKLTTESSSGKLFHFPEKLAADEKHNKLYIADSGHDRLIAVDLATSSYETIGDGTIGRKDGSFRTAQFNYPQGIALMGDKLYVADTQNSLIRQVDLSTHTVSTIAGTGECGAGGKGGSALSTKIDAPYDIAAIGNNLYIAVAGMHQIWRMDLKLKTVECAAGSESEGIKDGTATLAQLAQPTGLTTDGKALYFVDSESNSVRKFDVSSGAVTTLIGKGFFVFGDRDGPDSIALLQHPLGICFHDGLLFVADTFNHRIKTIDLKHQACTTFAGTGKSGSIDGQKAQFANPDGMAILGPMLYVADTNNNAIRVVNLSTGNVSTLSKLSTSAKSN